MDKNNLIFCKMN